MATPQCRKTSEGPSLVAEIRSSGSKVPGTFNQKGVFGKSHDLHLPFASCHGNADVQISISFLDHFKESSFFFFSSNLCFNIHS